MKKRTMLIIGSGLSAHQLAKHCLSAFDITMITKGKLNECNSMRAQGGIAAAIEPHDHPFLHLKDTLKAGSFYNDLHQVKTLVDGAKEVMDDLTGDGFKFDGDKEGRLISGQEGAHQKRRIYHAGGDQTGRYLMDFYHQQVIPYIKVIEDNLCVDLITNNHNVHGVVTIDQQNQYHVYQADVTILATGGYAGIYLDHSNDNTVTGDGISLAFRAGAKVADLEFVQFHPTLFKGVDRYHLISEAVRGEGARLRDESNNLIMKDHPLSDLAPRDVVSQVLTKTLNEGKQVYLDLKHVNDFESRFPSITRVMEEAGYKSDERLPVKPGAHFTMGGVKVDSHGKTSMNNLYAIGEVSAHRLHGANRLASNSLLESLVFPKRLAKHLQLVVEPIIRIEVELPKQRQAIDFTPIASAVKRKNTEFLGVLRQETKLLNYLNWLTPLVPPWEGLLAADNIKRSQIESEHLLTVSFLVINHCLKRRTSLGAHVIQLDNKNKNKNTTSERMLGE